jgi:Suppressor of fused protein (SUFU)
MNLEEYKNQFTEEDAVGWLSIDKEFEKIYGNQKPEHFAPALYFSIGGEDPLDGISIYKSKKQADHLHFVSYGFSELYYNEEKVGGDFSKWGFELTFRLKLNENDNGSWVLSLLQNIAKYVFKTGKWFEEFHVFPANGPICLGYETEITAVAFILDPEIGTIMTPHGEVSFLQMVGITTNEYKEFKLNPVTTETEKIINKLKENNNLLITDLNRK